MRKKHKLGADYVTWRETIILYKAPDGSEDHYKECDKVEHEYMPTCGLSQAIDSYGIHPMYEDGTWTCNDSGKARVLAICEREGIPATAVTRVFKQLGGYWR